MSYWRRLPTIYEATDVEMAEEVEASEKSEQRHVIEKEQLGPGSADCCPSPKRTNGLNQEGKEMRDALFLPLLNPTL